MWVRLEESCAVVRVARADAKSRVGRWWASMVGGGQRTAVVAARKGEG
jgi:hypothetical protein